MNEQLEGLREMLKGGLVTKEERNMKTVITRYEDLGIAIIAREEGQYLIQKDGNTIYEIWDIGASNTIQVTHYGKQEFIVVNCNTNIPSKGDVVTTVNAYRPEGKKYIIIDINTLWNNIVFEHCED